jgi:hypothetical protein
MSSDDAVIVIGGRPAPAPSQRLVCASRSSSTSCSVASS